MNAREKILVITTVIIPLVATIADVGEDFGVEWEIVTVCYNTNVGPQCEADYNYNRCLQ